MDDSQNEKKAEAQNEIPPGYISDESDKAAQFLRDENDPDFGKTPEERAAIVCLTI